MGSKILAAALLATMVGGCEDEPLAENDGGLYADGSFASATVQGYVWDPEAYWFGLFLCGPPPPMGTCQAPPIVLPNTPLYAGAAVANAAVGLFDPLQPMQVQPLPYAASELSAIDGGYFITGVPLREAPPFFPVAVVPPGMPGGADGGFGSMIPPVGYLPTFTFKPIATARSTQCLSQTADLATDGGALEAVAKFLTFTGKPTAVTDFLDPTKVGGVAVFWLWMPGSSALRLPATAVQMTADTGTTYNIAWAPPGVGPPFQSKRGFFVTPMPNTNPAMLAPAVTVTVLPPLMGPPPMVTFTTTDPVTDATTGRPWMFPALPPAQLAPGLITFGELQGLSPGADPPPDFICLP